MFVVLVEGMVFNDDICLFLFGFEVLVWCLCQYWVLLILVLLFNWVDGQCLLLGVNGYGGYGVGGFCVFWSDLLVVCQFCLVCLILLGIQCIGVFYGKDSEFFFDEFCCEVCSQGFELFVVSSSGNDDLCLLQFLFGNSDLLFGIDDKQLYNLQSIKSLLFGSYVKNCVLFGFIVVFVKVGSLVSSYSDQEDWLDIFDELFGQVFRYWFFSFYLGYFKVFGNWQVVCFLGIDLVSDVDFGWCFVEGEEL